MVDHTGMDAESMFGNARNQHSEDKRMAVVQIGNTASKGDLDAVAGVILRIIEARCDEETKRDALAAFGRVAKIEGIAFNSCYFSAGQPKSDQTDEARREIDRIEAEQ